MVSIGIDIGSTSSKTAVLDEDRRIITRSVIPTGWSSTDTAALIKSQLEKLGHTPGENPVVATGYGRVAVPYADKTVTEISCHAAGAYYLFHYPKMTVIDIGGQDTKIINIEDGILADFAMNDKCSAGTGRFLEVMANTLGLSPNELCTLAAEGGGTSISSMCTVFAESEVISLIGKGENKENIAFAVVDSIVRKVCTQARRLIGSGKLCLTGGLCEVPTILEALSRELKKEVESCPDARYAGAIGAALAAAKLR